MASDRRVDLAIWRACAGKSMEIPKVNSRVYYFPQGHLEQSSNGGISSSDAIRSRLLTCIIECRVREVDYLVDCDTDEVFARIRLIPLQFCAEELRLVENEQQEHRKDIVSYAKVLTQSDSNNGGGFSVPRFCADSIFPPLDFTADPPVQNLRITDVHGKEWEFRHIYRGTPRRHLLTTGWSKFVNAKMLIAGDSVVFMKDNHTGERCVGIRRAMKETLNWFAEFGTLKVEEEIRSAPERRGSGSFSRATSGRIPAEKVVNLAEMAAKGLAFEVSYYPRIGTPPYIVAADKVDNAMRVCWTAGMRVKMAVEMDDSSRINWYEGTVSNSVRPKDGVWQGSPWRMLQVAWDQPEVLKNPKKVSPWEVECVSPTLPPLQTAFPFPNQFWVPRSNPIPTIGEEDPPLQITQFSRSTIGQSSSTYLNYNSTPVGIQGARQNLISMNYNNYYQRPEPVSTDLIIGRSPSRSASPCPSPCLGQQENALPERAGLMTFQLFGTIITVQDPLGEDESMGGASNPPDLSLSLSSPDDAERWSDSVEAESFI